VEVILYIPGLKSSPQAGIKNKIRQHITIKKTAAFLNMGGLSFLIKLIKYFQQDLDHKSLRVPKS
jgi:hypothetical protein